ncbi:MAG: hypothetical protein KAX31_03465 [Thermoplasmata archaeon]|nr:hypothetical protein [Thermoplasmata archaeon]
MSEKIDNYKDLVKLVLGLDFPKDGNISVGLKESDLSELMTPEFAEEVRTLLRKEAT